MHPKSFRLSRYALLALLLLAAAPAFAASETLTLDPAKAVLTFTLGATAHTVEGKLALTRGIVTFDRASGAAGGEIRLDATKTATGSDGRDKNMHQDVLLSAKFPEIVFTPQKIDGQLAPSGKSKIGLRGKVSLAGVEHELVLPTEVEIAGGHVKATSTFKVPYVSWGLHDPSGFMLRVDKEVTVTLKVEGELAAAP